MTSVAAAPRRLARAAMDTYVAIGLPAGTANDDHDELIRRAFRWFSEIESVCTRFDDSSEVMGLLRKVGQPVPISATLYQIISFVLAVAQASDGVFDPTVGASGASRGFNRNYRTGEIVPIPPGVGSGVSYRDLELDDANQTITLHRPVVLDLGAVAKGLAIDLAARELAPLRDYTVEAGGDLYLAGTNGGKPWKVAIRDPGAAPDGWYRLTLKDAAVCTSGGYARPAAITGHHLIDPRSGESPDGLVSMTVVAPNAMLADALSTAAFVLGQPRGLQFLDEHAVHGLALVEHGPAVMTGGLRTLLDVEAG